MAIKRIKRGSPDKYIAKAPIEEATMASIAHVNHVVEEVNRELANLSSVRPKVYKALLTQSGTAAPVATVLQNNLGNISWSYDSVGYYIGTLDDAFVDNKTVIIPPSNSLSLDIALSIESFATGRNDIDSIYLNTGYMIFTAPDNVTKSSNNDVLNNHLIIIEVYP
jgi:hypothetical protein